MKTRSEPARSILCRPAAPAALPAAALLVTALLLAPALAQPAAAADFDETVTLDADTLLVTNLIGAVTIEGGRGSSFEVEIRGRGADASPQRLEIHTEEGSKAELAIVFPDESRFVYPEMGAGSNSSFTLPLRGEGSSSWLSALFGGDRVKVSGSGSGLELWADLTIRVPPGKTLDLAHGVGRIQASGVEGNLVLDGSSSRVLVESLTGDLDVDTGSGSIEVRDVDGDILLDTGSGRVEVARSRGKSLDVDTGSGRVTLTDVDSQKVRVDTGSGRVTASGLRADSAEIDTGSGSVEVAFGRIGGGRFEIDTGSGGIKLRLPAGASAEVEADTGSGSVSVDVADAQIESQERDNARFRVGSGDARITLDAGSGSIRVTN